MTPTHMLSRVHFKSAGKMLVPLCLCDDEYPFLWPLETRGPVTIYLHLTASMR